MTFDGSKFTKVSSEGYASDGIEANDAAPLDTALHFRARSNNRRLDRDYDRCSVALNLPAGEIFRTVDPTGRPVSFGRILGKFFYFVPVIFESTVDKVVIDVGANFPDVGSGVSYDGGFFADFFTLGGGASLGARGDVEKITTGDDYQLFRITLDRERFDDRIVNLRIFPGVYELAIGVSFSPEGSVPEAFETISQFDGGVNTVGDIIQASAGDYEMVPATTPNQPLNSANQLDIQATFRGGSRARHILALGGDDDQIVKVGVDINHPGGIDNSTPEKRFVPYALIRHIAVTVNYRNKTITDSEMRSNISEDASVMRRHSFRVESHWGRPQMASIGQRGKQRNPANGWPLGYRSMWTTDLDDALVEASVGPLQDAAVVEVFAGVIPTWIQSLDDAIVPEFPSDAAAVAEWEFEVELAQLEDGSGTPVVKTSGVIVDEFEHISTASREASFPLRSFLRHGDGGQGDEFTYEEGNFLRPGFDQDGDPQVADDVLIQFIRIPVEIQPGAGIDDTLPIDVTLTCQRTAEAARFFGPNAELNNSDAFLRMTLVAHSIYWRRAI